MRQGKNMKARRRTVKKEKYEESNREINFIDHLKNQSISDKIMDFFLFLSKMGESRGRREEDDSERNTDRKKYKGERRDRERNGRTETDIQ